MDGLLRIGIIGLCGLISMGCILFGRKKSVFITFGIPIFCLILSWMLLYDTVYYVSNEFMNTGLFDFLLKGRNEPERAMRAILACIMYFDYQTIEFIDYCYYDNLIHGSVIMWMYLGLIFLASRVTDEPIANRIIICILSIAFILFLYGNSVHTIFSCQLFY